MQYVVRRLFYMIPTMVLVSIVIFWLMRILPGDVATLILVGPSGGGEGGNVPKPEQIAALRAQLGLDRPIWVQYLDWMRGMARLDVGNSLWTRQPVFTELFRRLPLTIWLGILATMISLTVAIPLGILAAVKRGTWIDVAARTFAVGGLSLPNFWVGILMILALVTYFGWAPPLGYVGLTEDPWKNFQQLIWPALALGYAQAGLVSRLVRSSLLEVMREDYVRTARSKGLNETRVIIRHALRNSLLPVVTVLGLSLAGIVSGTVIMETVFSLPGVGRFMVEAIDHRDHPVVQTLTFVFALIYALMNLAVDLVYVVIDPRIRLS